MDYSTEIDKLNEVEKEINDMFEGQVLDARLLNFMRTCLGQLLKEKFPDCEIGPIDIVPEHEGYVAKIYLRFPIKDVYINFSVNT